MAKVFTIDTEAVIPAMDAVLREQGVGEGYEISATVKGLYERAVELYKQSVRVRGIFESVSKDEFGSLYQGEGHNDESTPVADLFSKAERLALFAVTLGREVSDRISESMAKGNFALGVMLDAAASQGAELAADELEREYEAGQPGKSSPLKVLRYSPGYCGWHVSGQKKLFERLRPGDIGVALNERYLMSPLKSISGVLIAAEKENHYFDMTYACCESCDSFACRDRLAGLDND